MIQDGDPVILVYLEDQEFYVLADLTNDPQSENPVLTLVPAYQDTESLSPSPWVILTALFHISGATSSVQLAESNPNSGAYLAGKDQVLSLSDSATSLTAKQDNYQEWGPPEILLSCVSYNFYTDTSSQDPLQVYILRAGETSSTLITTPLIAVSTISYYGCNGETCDVANTISQALKIAYCNILKSPPNACLPIIQSWTTTSDAGQGKVYNYCSSGTNCSSNCKGPCTKTNYECLYDGQSFVCKFSIWDLFSGQWWKKPWFLVLIGLSLVIGAIFLIAVYLSFKQGKQPASANRIDYKVVK